MREPIDKETIEKALGQVRYPGFSRDILSFGLLRGIEVTPNGKVTVGLAVTTADPEIPKKLYNDIESVLKAAGAIDPEIAITVTVPNNAPAASTPSTDSKLPIDAGVKNVKYIVAVASGKGGVGKSTVSVNLACALARLGLKVGLLDADVYGPSIPRMLGLTDEPVVGAGGKLQPISVFGIKAMSIGLMVDEAAPMIWRGPMASSALNQMLNDVAWGSEAEPLDVLVIDMPPGTGDIQLTRAQKVAVSGAVVVSTPQAVALIDVRRGISMFEKTHVPILGVVENMAYFTDPSTGAPIEIFGRGGARETAETLGAPFLGEVPIDIALRQACDDGKPLVIDQPDSPAGLAFMDIAVAVAAGLEAGADERPAPTMRIVD